MKLPGFGKGKEAEPEVLELYEPDDPEAAYDVVDTRPAPQPNDARLALPWPSCTAVWILPLFTVIAVGGVGASVNAIADDFYTGLVAATATCAAILLLTILYNLGRVLQARYHANPYLNRFFYLVFLPVACLRWNANEVVASATAPPPPDEYVRPRTD